MNVKTRISIEEIVNQLRLDKPCRVCGAEAGALCRNVSREPVGDIRSDSHFYRGAGQSENADFLSRAVPLATKPGEEI